MAVEIPLKTYEVWNHRSQLDFLSAIQNEIRNMKKDYSIKPYGLEFTFYSKTAYLPIETITRTIEKIIEQMRLFVIVKDSNTAVIDRYAIIINNKASENKVVVRRIV